MLRIISATLFLGALTALVLFSGQQLRVEPASAANVPRELTLQPPRLSCVASCSPGGGGNTYCQGVYSCGAGSVCLSVDNQSHGRCNSGNAGQF